MKIAEVEASKHLVLAVQELLQNTGAGLNGSQASWHHKYMAPKKSNVKDSVGFTYGALLGHRTALSNYDGGTSYEDEDFEVIWANGSREEDSEKIGKKWRTMRRRHIMVVTEVVLEVYSQLQLMMLSRRNRGAHVCFHRSVVEQLST